MLYKFDVMAKYLQYTQFLCVITMFISMVSWYKFVGTGLTRIFILKFIKVP